MANSRLTAPRMNFTGRSNCPVPPSSTDRWYHITAMPMNSATSSQVPGDCLYRTQRGRKHRAPRAMRPAPGIARTQPQGQSGHQNSGQGREEPWQLRLVKSHQDRDFLPQNAGIPLSIRYEKIPAVLFRLLHRWAAPSKIGADYTMPAPLQLPHRPRQPMVLQRTSRRRSGRTGTSPAWTLSSSSAWTAGGGNARITRSSS